MKTRTRSIFRLLFLTTLISSSLLVQAQSPRIKAVHIANKFVNKGDTVQIMLNGARGSIQWQKSMDANTWNNITGATTEILSYKLILLTTSGRG